VHPLELISARIDGKITAGETRYLEAHLQACAPCRQKESELSEIAIGLAGLPLAPAPAGATDRLLARLREERQRNPRTAPAPAPAAEAPAVEVPAVRARRRLGLRSWAAAAAGLAALFVLYSIVSRTDSIEKAAAHPLPEPPAVVAQVQAAAAPAEPSISVSTPVPTRAAAPNSERAPHAGSAAASSAPTVVVARPAPPSQPEPTPSGAIVSEAFLSESDEARLVLDPDHFRKDGKRLTPEARQLVERVAEFLRAHERVELLIEGRSDERRSAEKNLALAHKRALVVARELKELGIDPARLRVVPAAADAAASAALKR
jgi:outer membrane protein OmpA-like peptidoglycan-associated protein